MEDTTSHDGDALHSPAVVPLRERAHRKAAQAWGDATGGDSRQRYEYRDQDGSMCFVVEASDDGSRRVLIPEHPAYPDGPQRPLTGGFAELGNRARPYGLRRLPSETAEQVVWLAEDEQLADRLHALGAVGLAVPDGFDSWQQSWSRYFGGRRVALIVSDMEASRRATAGLAEHAAEVRLARLSEAPNTTDLVGAWDNAQRVGGDVFPVPFRPLSGASTLDLPAFPIDVLPEYVKDLVEAVAEATATDPTMASWFAIGAASALLAPHVRTSAHNHETGMNVFAVVAAPSGTAKSPVYERMFAPVFEWQTELLAEHGRLAPELEAEHAAAAFEVRQCEQDLKSAVKDRERPERRIEAQSRLAEARRALAALPPMHEPVIVHDDSSPESVARTLAEQNGSLTIASSEGGLFDLLDGKMYSSRPNLNPYLKGWSQDFFRIDRGGLRRSKGAGEGDGVASATVEQPTLTVTVAVQPGVLEQIGARSIERGLMARFLYASVTARFGYREEDRPPVPDDAANAYNKAMTELTAAAAAAGSVTLQLEPQARTTYVRWRERVERRTRPGGDLSSPELRAWAEKAKLYGARIAGLLHLLHCGAAGLHEPIAPERVEEASRILDAAAPHAAKVFNSLGDDAAVVRARIIGDWIASQGLSVFAARDAQLALRNRSAFQTVEDVYAGLNVLEEHGWIRQHVEPTAGRPRTRWLVANEVHAHGGR